MLLNILSSTLVDSAFYTRAAHTYQQSWNSTPYFNKYMYMYVYKRVVYHLKAVKPKCTQQKDSFPLGESWRDCDETSVVHIVWIYLKGPFTLSESEISFDLGHTARCEQKIGFARKSSGSSVAFAFAFAQCKCTLNVHMKPHVLLISNSTTSLFLGVTHFSGVTEIGSFYS